MVNRSRVGWIDCARGIAILCVIIGHTTNDFIIRGVIFSFHMPLFFICSGMTYRVSQNNEEFLKKLKKSFIALPLTATILFLAKDILLWILPYNSVNTFSITKELKALFFSSGVPMDSFIGNVKAIGMTWFFFVLFTARMIYDYICMKLDRKYAAMVAVLLMIVGYIFSKRLWLPFSMDIVLVVVIFIISGSWYKSVFTKYENISIAAAAGIVILWAGLFTATYFIGGTYLALASRTYPAFPLCLVTALAGTASIFCISIIMQKAGKLFKLLEIAGRNSLLLFEIHYFDDIWSKLWNVFDNSAFVGQLGNTALRLIIDIVIFAVIYMLKSKYYTNKKSVNKENA